MDIVKNGWHPEKEGTTLKQQVKFWKKDDAPSQRASGHSSAPLSSLKDPSSFGPPPKRTGAIGEASSPTVQSAASPTQPRAGYQAAQSQVPVANAAPDAAPAPRGTWSMDTTGLSTSHLPPPPGRAGAVPPSPSAQAKPNPPSLPPRLPPRATGPALPARQEPVPPPPKPEVATKPQSAYINQGAAGRLGAAGISVPGFGIGAGKGVSSPSEGTSFAQKQAAVRTAANFRDDPSSVSASDLRSAASTANNFRQRHGEQVAAGVKGAQGMNQKYGLSDKIGQYGGSGAGSSATASPGLPALAKKKPPPPVPVKRGDLEAVVQQARQEDDAPPPVPASTRPRF